MWALLRASTPIRNKVLGIGATCTCLRLDVLTTCTDVKRGISTSHVSSDSAPVSNWFHNAIRGPSGHGIDRRSLSSQAGARSSGEEDDLEDGFSELDSPEKTIPTQTANLVEDDMFISDTENFDDDGDLVGPSQNDLDLSEATDGVDEKRPINRRAYSELFQAIMSSQGLSIHGVLDKWVSEGKDLNRSEISITMLNLRKRRFYGRALQLSEFLETNKHLDFIERDYASRVDLIAKVHGLPKAEHYVAKIPKSFRGGSIYQTLLANCVVTNNVKKAEDVFNQMEKLGFPITVFSCNQLLILYKRFQKQKIADILLLMEKKNIKPTPFTYKILIDVKGQSHDMVGMDQVIETMKADGFEPDINTQAIMVKHYASSGLKDRAVEVLKDIEGNDLNEKRWVCRFLLPLYGVMQMADEVERVWNVCKSDPRIEESMSVIHAWGKLHNIEQAEAEFDRMLKTWKKLSTRPYHLMLKVYTDHKMLTKGKDLVKRMADNGCYISPFTWDAIVKLYVEAGDVEKADSFLRKAIQQKSMRPMQCSFLTILDQYAGRGDVHNAEKVFQMMKDAGYVRPRQFHSLLQAYFNAKKPAYGMRDRMKADNIYINNRALSTLLAQVSVFRMPPISDLLD